MLFIYPDKTLRRVSKPLHGDPSEIIKLLNAELGSGVLGIAAPQIGIHKRVFIINGVGVFINPEITNRSKNIVLMEEGCLSCPGKLLVVPRAEEISFKALDENLKQISGSFSGIKAAVFQHELDHLDGILIIDKAINL